jgi:tetratricopeptide (TPR) repeat protein
MKRSIYTILTILALSFSVLAQLQVQNEVVNMFTLRKLVRENPDQKEIILSQANEVVRQVSGARLVISQYTQVAEMFLNAGIYPENAEVFAKKGLEACDLKKFIESSKEVFKQNNATMQTDEAITLDFWNNKARLLSILGRIQVKLNKISEAEINLTESHKIDRMDPLTALALSEIIEKKGDTKTAFDYLIPAVFSNGVKQSLIDRLERLYQTNHGGKLDGLEEYLDKKYHEVFPFKVEAYKPTAKRTKRIVLAELFSGAGCSPCVAVDLAFDGILQRYNRQDVAVLVYHLHNPRPDPMANEETTARANYYGLRGAPSVAIDGDFNGSGIGSNDWDKAKSRFDDFRAKIEKELETAPAADLNLTVSKTGSLVKVKATVGNIKKPSENLKLHIMLAEDSIRYTGENGIWYHPFVVRSMATPDAKGLVVDASKQNPFEHNFDVAKISEILRVYLDEFEKNPPKEFKTGEAKFRQKLYAIDEKNLSVVAFLQDEKTRQVLQTVYFKVK